MLGETFQRFPGQVHPRVIGVIAFQPCQRPDALGIVVIPACVNHRLFKRRLASVSEGRMADVVTQAERFGQILVQTKFASDDAADLGDLDTVREAGSIVVAVGRHEDLRLGAQAAKGDRMDDPVAIALELAARTAGPVAVFGKFASARSSRIGSVRSSVHGAPRLRSADSAGQRERNGNLTAYRRKATLRAKKPAAPVNRRRASIPLRRGSECR